MDPVAIDYHVHTAAPLKDAPRIGVHSQFRDKEEIKQLPGALWRHNEGLWTMPLSWAAMQQLRGVFGERLEVGETLVDMANEVYEYRIKPCLELRDAVDAPWVPDEKLTPLQKAGAAFMATACRALNCDPMGSGKTPQTIVAMKVMQELYGKQVFPCLVVCGNGAKPHWKREFEEWWPGVRVVIVTGSAHQRRKQLAEEADVYVINWEGIKGHSRLAKYGNIALTDKQKEPKELNEMTFVTGIFDEIHRAKDPKAQQTRAAYAVADEMENIFGLTGSLVANTPLDLWSPMRITAKDEYPGKSKFVDRYALMSFDTYGYLKVVGLRGDTKDELFRFLDPRFIRRPKDVILPELAENGKLPIETRVVQLAPKQRKAYDQLRKEMIVQLEGGVLLASNPLTWMMRLRQLSGATGVVVENEDPDAKPEIDLVEPSTKIDEFMSIVDESDGASIAVYCESKKLAKLAVARCDKEGVLAVEYTGDVNPEERESNRERFQSGDAQVIVLTYAAGAESIDLSKAAILVRLEFSWSAIKNSQAEERPVRKGREGPLLIIDVLSESTVDFEVRETYGDKLDMLEEVMRDQEIVARWLAIKP